MLTLKDIALTAIVLVLPVLSYAQPSSSEWCSVPKDAVAPDDLAFVIRHTQPELNTGPQPRAHAVQPSIATHNEGLEEMRNLKLVRNAALIWRINDDGAYLSFVKNYLSRWVDIYEPDFNPIGETSYDQMLQTYALIVDQLDLDTQARAMALFRRWATEYIRQMKKNLGKKGLAKYSSFKINWESHRIKLITMMAVVLKDKSVFDQAKELFWLQVNNNINPDGSVIDFYQRDALHYVVYDLEPLLQAALAARNYNGEDWFHVQAANGASLERAVQWLVPYANGMKSHEEFVHSQIAYDAQRAQAGLKGYSGPWDPKTSANLYWMASEFDPSYAPLAQQLNKRKPSNIALCGE